MISFLEFSPRRYVGLLVVCVSAYLFCGSSLLAGVGKISLPGDYADFAFAPGSGDVAAVDPAKDRAFLFREKSLRPGAVKADAEVRVGSKPTSIFYKEFGKTKVYAVVCESDSHMYLINSSDFTLMKKVSLDQSGVIFVTGSTNPEDPFIYYFYGTGHDSVAGAVSLRDLKNKGEAFDDAADGAISADGGIAYRRGPWSPSGFESLIRVSRLEDDKPEFQRLFYDHNSTSHYLPGPFGEVTASSKDIYNPSLAKKIASVDFLPYAFFKSEPVVIGRTVKDPRSRRAEEADAVILRAASYNNFAQVGSPIKLSYKPPPQTEEEKRASRSSRSARKRERYFADDGRKRLLFAARTSLYLVPLADFGLPGEPFLLAQLQGAEDVVAGEAHTFEIKPRDPKVSVTIDDMPEGAKADGMSIRWTPGLDRVGSHAITITLKHGDIERTQRFPINVTYPRTKLPFSAAGIAVGKDGTRVLIWEGALMDRWNRVKEGTEVDSPQLAVIDQESGKVLVQRKMSAAIGGALIAGEYAVIYGRGGDVARCEVLNLEDLQRKQSLTLTGTPTELSVVGKLLVVRSERGIEVYDTESFKKIKSTATDQFGWSRSAEVTKDGLYIQGVLYDSDFKPRLISEADQRLLVMGDRVQNRPVMLDRNGNGQQDLPRADRDALVATHRVDDSLRINILNRQKRVDVAGATHTWKTTREIEIAASGTGDQVRQVLMRGADYSRVASSIDRLKLPWAASDSSVYLVDGTDLYAWSWAGKTGRVDADSKLKWALQQSALTLDSSGKTVLTHELSGADESTQISLVTPIDGMNVESTSRSVTIDNATVLKAASEFVKRSLMGFNRGESHAETLKRVLPSYKELASSLIGSEPNGVPVLVPVRLNARSSDLDSASLGYYVVAEVPTEAMSKMFLEMDSEREEKKAAAMAKRVERAAASGASGAPAVAINLAPLNQRIKALEDEKSGLEEKNDALDDRIVVLETQRESLEAKLDKLAERSSPAMPIALLGVILGVISLLVAFRPRKA